MWLTLGQIAGIAIFAIWAYGIATKAHHDIFDIMRQYAGEFWRRFMEYLIKNIGGG